MQIDGDGGAARIGNPAVASLPSSVPKFGDADDTDPEDGTSGNGPSDQAIRLLVRHLHLNVLASDEYLATGPDTRDQVTRLYRAALGRFPTTDERDDWATTPEDGDASPANLLNRLATEQRRTD